MPQKGQIKHDWVELSMVLSKCLNCKTIRKSPIFAGEPATFLSVDKFQFEETEPPCITSKIQADENAQV